MPEYGEPIADEDALAIEGPEAADPVGICGSFEWDADTEGGVVGKEEKWAAFWSSADSKDWL